MHLLAMLLLAADVTSPSQSRPTGCADRLARPFCARAGTLWCGTSDTATFEDLALHGAPILWFSPDEPLFREQRPIPQELAFDLGDDGRADGSGRVVYWQVEKVLADGRDKARTRDLILKQHLVPLADVETLTVSFFFYYERDLGMNPHYHDLEGVELQLDVEAASGDGPDAGYRRVYVGRATGLGHGSGLLSNILQIRPTIRKPAGSPDVTMPLTVLVEEGKHASCPDRNADGVYTPGYDVNIRVPDAWGLRDVFGTGVLASQYQPWMSKSRNPADRYAVDGRHFAADDPFSPVGCYKTGMGHPYPDATHSYELRPVPRCSECATLTTDAAFCSAACQGGDWKPVPVGGGELEQALCLKDSDKVGKKKCKQLNMPLRVRQAFRREPDITFASLRSKLGHMSGSLRYKYGPAWQIQFFRQSLAPSVRFDGRDFGLGLSFYSPYGLPKFAGWPALRYGLIREGGAFRGRFDLSYTASIARLSDAYIAAGYDWGLERTHLDEVDPTSPDRGVVARVGREDAWAVEGGVQVRFRAFSLRTGVRGSLAGGRIDALRVVGELGYGPKPEHAKIH